MSQQRQSSDEQRARAGIFATTHWSVVMLAGEGDSPTATAALEKLCTTYWFPIYAEVRRRGVKPEDAQDVTQEFLATLLRRNFLNNVTADKGRFRTFLVVALKRFLTDQWNARSAAKRGGGLPVIELDALQAEQRLAIEPATDETPDKAFDRRWAAALLEQAFSRLEKEQSDGNAGTFARLKPLLTRPVEPGEYDGLAADLGLTTNAIAQAVRRLRLRTRELMLEEAAQTVAAAGDAEKELRELFA